MTPKKQEKTDFCGPYGDHWFIKLISKLIPDEIFGVYLGSCCEEHDKDIVTNGPNKHGDELFESCIRCQLSAHLKSNLLVNIVAFIYYVGGRVGAAHYRLR